jgi:hypothetical protein
VSDESPKVRRVKVTAEAVVEVTDGAALEQAVLADIGAVDFRSSDERNAEEMRQEELDRVAGDPVAAVGWLVRTAWSCLTVQILLRCSRCASAGRSHAKSARVFS